MYNSLSVELLLVTLSVMETIRGMSGLKVFKVMWKMYLDDRNIKLGSKNFLEGVSKWAWKIFVLDWDVPSVSVVK